MVDQQARRDLAEQPDGGHGGEHDRLIVVRLLLIVRAEYVADERVHDLRGRLRHGGDLLGALVLDNILILFDQLRVRVVGRCQEIG